MTVIYIPKLSSLLNRNGITVCNLQNTLTILAGKAGFDDRFVITTVKHRTRAVPVRERCPVLWSLPLLGASWMHPGQPRSCSCPALSKFSLVLVSGQPWFVHCCCQADGTGWVLLTFAQQELSFVCPSAPQPKATMKSYRHVFILETYKGFLTLTEVDWQAQKLL